ncbi:tumor necrosis factor receptor superfamily member 16-like [Montipora foliosa]|uniref:tumor necrosis factor receptor superfamily member 16-like n=1 Tax=Montipora foliosa TaxID=591990 RepID=UPI0035F1FFD2
MDLDKPALASNQNFCHSFVKGINPAVYCSKNQFIVDHADGSTSCEDCETCPRGQGLSHTCGLRIPSDAMVNCVPCLHGVSFSSGDDTSSCAPCSSCVEDQVVLQNCISTHDVVCDKKCYSNDKYFDTSGNCLLCSKCCGDGEDKMVNECKAKVRAAPDMVCSFNRSANRCDVTTTASVLTRNTTVSTFTSNATLLPSVTTSLPSNFQSGSPHASSSSAPQPFEKNGDESGATHEKVVFGVIYFAVLVLVAFGTFGMCILCKRWIPRCRNCSGGTSDAEAGNVTHENEGTELRDVNQYTGNNESATEEGMTTAPTAHQDEDEEEEEEEPKGLSKPLLEKEPVQTTCVNCQKQDRRRTKDSKPLKSLLDDSDVLDGICESLDAHVPGRGNYRVVAEHNGFTHFKIKSVLEKCDGGPSRALIENIVAGDPDLTVEEFATVVEEKAKRKDVSKLLRANDFPEVAKEIV